MEENFYELYEQYLDEVAIQEKLKNDFKEEDNTIEDNKKYNNKSPFTAEDAISINEFVNNFLNIPTNANKLLHCGLKDLQSPYVVGVSNDFANKNPELVKNGYLILVIDYHNNRGTYMNPFYLKSLVTKSQAETDFNWISKQRINDFKELDEYYKKYSEAKTRVENNEKFYKLVEELRKTRKLNNITRFENESGGMKR